MTAYLSFEWLKFTKRWMPRVILLLVVALIALAFWGQGARATDPGNVFLPRAWLSALIFCSFFAPFFWPVLGGSWAGNEYGWGTIRMILTRRPHRIEHVLAALTILLIGLAIALVVVLVVATAAGFVVTLARGDSSITPGILTASFLATLVKGYLAAWYVAGFYLLLAYAAATIFRSAAVGIGIGIGSTLAQFILRGIFAALGGVWDTIARHFPVIYTNDLTTQVVKSGLIPGSNMASVDPSAPSAGQSVLAIAIYAAILLALTLIAVRTRDVTA